MSKRNGRNKIRLEKLDEINKIDRRMKKKKIRENEEQMKQLESKMTYLNPNRYPKYTAKGKNKKDVSLRKAEAWDRYLTPEQREELKDIETQYHVKKRIYEKYLKEYLKKNNLSDMIKKTVKRESK